MIGKLKFRWFAQYQCGCSADAANRRDLLNYCARHGSERTELFKHPVPAHASQKGKP